MYFYIMHVYHIDIYKMNFVIEGISLNCEYNYGETTTTFVNSL